MSVAKKYKVEKLSDMRPISLEEHRLIQLQILCTVAEFCEKRGIRYYLSDGTLIGAIRHKGFIPWDDDIDIEMPRPDYNRFKEEFYNQGNLRIVCPGDSDSRFHNAKVIRTDTIKIEEGINYRGDYLGVDIDVFMVDGCPNDQKEYEKLRNHIFKLYNIYAQIKCGLAGSYKHRAKIILLRMIYGAPDKIISHAMALCEKYNFDNSQYIARYGRFSLGFRVPSTCYSDYIYKEFEGYKFRVPIGYDTVLKAQFGDYMTLPPIEKQITHHSNKVYWKNSR